MTSDANRHSIADDFLTVTKGLAPGRRLEARNEAMLALIRIEKRLAELEDLLAESLQRGLGVAELAERMGHRRV